jgi:hypothetical protein
VIKYQPLFYHTPPEDTPAPCADRVANAIQTGRNNRCKKTYNIVRRAACGVRRAACGGGSIKADPKSLALAGNRQTRRSESVMEFVNEAIVDKSLLHGLARSCKQYFYEKEK